MQNKETAQNSCAVDIAREAGVSRCRFLLMLGRSHRKTMFRSCSFPRVVNCAGLDPCHAYLNPSTHLPNPSLAGLAGLPNPALLIRLKKRELSLLVHLPNPE